MKNTIIKGSLLLMLSGFLMMASCTKESGQGPLITKTLNIADFSGVIMPGADDVVITYGKEQKVVAIGNENVINSISTSVEHGVWNMKLNENFSNYDLRYEITVPRMSSIKVSGSANVVSERFKTEKDVLVTISGSGNIHLEDYEGYGTLNANISGSGNVYIHGANTNFDLLNIGISGSGNYLGFPLSVNGATTNISGSGNSEVYANDDLIVNISGSGNVSYKGYPSIISYISGSGNIINAN